MSTSSRGGRRRGSPPYERFSMHRPLPALCAAACLTATAVLAVPALADERSCRGMLGKISVDDLRVPQGATCTLTGTRVKGTITVARRATLYARGGRVIGNV